MSLKLNFCQLCECNKSLNFPTLSMRSIVWTLRGQTSLGSRMYTIGRQDKNENGPFLGSKTTSTKTARVLHLEVIPKFVLKKWKERGGV